MCLYVCVRVCVSAHLSLRVLRVQFSAPAQTQFRHLLVVGLARHVQRRVAALVVYVDRSACAQSRSAVGEGSIAGVMRGGGLAGECGNTRRGMRKMTGGYSTNWKQDTVNKT